MENSNFELVDEVVPKHGGYRPGSGRKPGVYVKPQEKIDYDEARARNESAKAQINEIELKKTAGEYGSRAAFRQATATVLASLAQTLRSVPDNLERKMGVSAEVAEEVGAQIDAALDDLANEFEMLTNA